MTNPFPNQSAWRASALLTALLVGLVAAGCGSSDVAGARVSGASAASARQAESGAPGSGGTAGSAAGASHPDSGGGITAAGVSGVGTSSAGEAGSRSSGSAGGGLGGAGTGSAGGSGNAGAASFAGGSGGSVSLPPHSGPWRITPLGDSITGTTCGPQLLSKALIEHDRTNFTFVGSNLNNQSCNGAGTVQTEGHGGYLVTDLVGSGQHASELPQWCDSNKSDLVLMQFGTNDVWNDRAPSAILDAYSTVLTDLRAANPNVIVLVAQITPLNPMGCAACETRVVALNSQIPAWASSKNTAASRVLVVDLHSAFSAASYTPTSTYTADGVHPNVAGAQLIADKWYDALTTLGAP